MASMHFGFTSYAEVVLFLAILPREALDDLSAGSRWATGGRATGGATASSK